MTSCSEKVQEPSWQEQYDLGVRFLSEGNYEEAIIAFNAAIEIDPKLVDAYLGLADVYIAQGDYETAREILEGALDEVGEEPSIRDRLAAFPSETEDRLLLGDGNIANGGFATGNKTYMYYVTHPTRNTNALKQERMDNGDVKEIYSAQGISNLILVEDTLYFCTYENTQASIVKLNTVSGEIETIYITPDGIWNMEVYGNDLYFTSINGLMKCSIQGENPTNLFENGNIVPFCIVGDKIYYTDPQLFATGGFYFGKLMTMDLSGGEKTELVSSEVVENTYIFSDGTWLYFWGVDGFMRCGFNGENLQTISQYGGQFFNTLEHDIYRGTYSDGLFRYNNDSKDWDLILNGGFDNLHLVGDWVYFTETNFGLYDSGVVTKRIRIDGTSETILG